MSYQEKKNIVSIVSGALLLGAYCIYAFGGAGVSNLDNLAFWGKTMLVFLGIGIAASIVIQIVFHILLSISVAVKRKINDESCDDKEIEKTIEREMVEDERDKLIDLKSGRISYIVFGVGFVAGLVAIAFGSSAVMLLNVLFLSALTGGIAESVAQLIFYRRGR